MYFNNISIIFSSIKILISDRSGVQNFQKFNKFGACKDDAFWNAISIFSFWNLQSLPTPSSKERLKRLYDLKTRKKSEGFFMSLSILRIFNRKFYKWLMVLNLKDTEDAKICRNEVLYREHSQVQLYIALVGYHLKLMLCNAAYFRMRYQ